MIPANNMSTSSNLQPLVFRHLLIFGNWKIKFSCFKSGFQIFKIISKFQFFSFQNRKNEKEEREPVFTLVEIYQPLRDKNLLSTADSGDHQSITGLLQQSPEVKLGNYRSPVDFLKNLVGDW